MSEIADRIATEVDTVVGEMDSAAIEAVPAFGADAGITGEMSASNRANLLRFVAVARRAEAPPPRAVPPEALDVARTIVRRGIEQAAIFEAYRRGQQIALERWTACVYEMVEPGPEQMRVTQLSIALLFDYVDDTLRQVLGEAQREREAVLGGALAMRTETVRLLLDGAPIDTAAASQRLGYDLARGHTALVLWADDPAVAHGALESTASLLAAAAGAGRPLILPAGTTTLWAWIGSDTSPSPEDLRAALAETGLGIRAALGPTRDEVSGFRSSHEAALSVQRLLAGRRGEQLSTFDELEVTALAATDPEQATDFVHRTLGALADDTSTAQRLRVTLQTFLEEAENAPRTAARLNMHRNTVLQRVARATDILGYRPGERRLRVELALELHRRLGPG